MLSFSIVVLVACGASIGELDQLEASTVDAGDEDFEALSASGSLSVEGADRDWSIALPELEQSLAVSSLAVHSAGARDLGRLDGREATLTLSEAGLHGERAMLVEDESGPLYVLHDGLNRDSMGPLFGSDFATWGPEVSSSRDSQYTWSWTSAIFRTDEGEVELLPGESAEIRVDGLRYEAVVLAAYQVEARPFAALPCGGISDLLSYELLRVDEEEPELDPVLRPAGEQLAHAGCL